jgi:enoyl-CoA hydratase/carnithine racemase
MSSQEVLIRKEENVMTISLNRPDKRNALTFEMCDNIEDAIEDAALDKDVRIVVLRGEGKSFCSGIDYNSIAKLREKYPTPPEFRFTLSMAQGSFNKIERMEKPVVALLHGHCYGMGLELALAADFRIAAQNTKIGLQEVELGLVPDVGGTTRLTRTVGIPLAKEIIMAARILDAEEAHRIHLVNEVAPAEAIESTLNAWLERLMAVAPLAMGFAKKIIDRGAHLDKLTFMELEGYAQSTLIGSRDVMEGVMARVEKRKPRFQGK